MKGRTWTVAGMVLGLLVAAAGPSQAEPSSGFRYEQHDCWIGKTHYSARTIEFWEAGRYTVTKVTYGTSPGAKAHRVEWRTDTDGVVQFSLGGSKKTKNDVAKHAELYPTVGFEAQKLIFTVWDGKKGYFCRDSYPETGVA